MGRSFGAALFICAVHSSRCYKRLQAQGLAELEPGLARSLGIMPKYRFITPERVGKWYADLHLAKQFASTIGAGFYDNHSGKFVAYPGTKLEIAH